MVLTLWENGSLVGVSSHASDGIVENVVIVNPTSPASPSYDAIKESEPSRISSADTRACKRNDNLIYRSSNHIWHNVRVLTNTCIELVNEP